jgi:hypothetical protein
MGSTYLFTPEKVSRKQQVRASTSKRRFMMNNYGVDIP